MQTLGIDKGDYVEVDVEEGNVVLKPRKLIDPSQGWYWTKEWQKMEADVDTEIKKNQLLFMATAHNHVTLLMWMILLKVQLRH